MTEEQPTSSESERPVTPGLTPDREPAGIPPEQPVSPPRRSRFEGLDRRLVVLGAITALLAITTLLFGLMALAPNVAPVKTGATREAAQQETRADVEAAARRFAAVLYTFNYRTIDADIAKIRAHATGGFQQELEEVLGDVDTYRKAIVDAQASSRGVVQGTEVRSIDGETASVRVFVLRSITNKDNREPRGGLDAVDLTLVRTSEGWKVDDVKQLQGGLTG